ncbi:antibiotic biosynthesis monooxygenase [Stackebrandtia nassauensis]|uniref:Antibiotic biosynthesis monooxygenase n=1 Tax=Stackebrandtia nassauensis (strain DSM 44728 / CIP 108903 / NRRL B-16338 / NBRC 102104 / LLR-40K-21) TaxID=446470 RepID=D3Q1H3_STANL|nr:antibiotic biosynthesis monooxygenase [Stackebrandtia nassauensis]ADD45753.1 Antibiotic biosynthesis monooxygenase [Stackebrandtia nassauensis DSM 44728]
MNASLIARTWSGRAASAEAADAYEAIFRDSVLPELRGIPGFAFAHLLRQDSAEGVRFTTVTFFASMDAIRAFAGTDPTRAHVSAAARAVLSRYDDHVEHHTAVPLSEP